MKKIIIMLMIALSVGVYAKSVSGYMYETKKENGKYYKVDTNELYTGKVKMYYESERDHIEIKGKFKEKEGKKDFYSHLTLSVEVNVVDGIENGEYFAYYRSGKVKEKGFYKDGKIEGTVTQYYENGTVFATVNLKNGKKEGIYKYYNENSIVTEKGNYKDNELDGKIYLYDEKGKLVKTIEFKGGVEVK